jgi:signal peptidase I
VRRKLVKALVVLVVLAGGLLVLILLTSKLYRIPSSAMESTLHCAKPAAGCEAEHEDRVLVSKIVYRLRDPQRGDIVAFKIPETGTFACNSFFGEVFLKRIVVMPGERWKEQGGFIYVNGKKLDEPYVKPARRDTQSLTLRDIPPTNTYTHIPKDYYLMMGDNRSSSCDSRRWGLVPRKNLIGKVFATYWPPSRISFH